MQKVCAFGDLPNLIVLMINYLMAKFIHLPNFLATLISENLPNASLYVKYLFELII